MWFFTLLTLRRSTSRSLLASTGFLLAACALILLSATTQTTVVQASAIINSNWRPTYDLVVLPPQAALPPGNAIPADLLEGYGGGISMQQYEQIKKLPGIELAAPIAFLGYVQVPVPEVPVHQHSPAAGLLPHRLDAYRVQWPPLHYRASGTGRLADLFQLRCASCFTCPATPSASRTSLPVWE